MTLSQANVQIQAYLLVFLACATLLGVVAQMSALYFCAVLGCGGYWWALAASAMRLANPARWARKVFGFSIVLVLILNLSLAIAR